MYKNKGADQLRGYRKADLRLCFRICKKPVFSRRGSNTNNKLATVQILKIKCNVCKSVFDESQLCNHSKNYRAVMGTFNTLEERFRFIFLLKQCSIAI